MKNLLTSQTRKKINTLTNHIESHHVMNTHILTTPLKKEAKSRSKNYLRKRGGNHFLKMAAGAFGIL